MNVEQLKIKVGKLSREQMVRIIYTFIDTHELNRADINLIKYMDAPDRIGQIQTGDAGQEKADHQYRHGC